MINLDNFSVESARNPGRCPNLTEAVRLRLQWLEPHERTLMEAHLIHHIPIRSLAGLLHASEKTIASRIKSLSRRLIHGRYIDIIRHRDQFHPLDRQIAYDSFMLNLGYRKIAQKRQLGSYEVRRRIETIQNRLDTLTRQQCG